jgi:hypothetical protein
MDLAQAQAMVRPASPGGVFLGLLLRGWSTEQLLRTQIGSQCRPMGAVSL